MGDQQANQPWRENSPLQWIVNEKQWQSFSCSVCCVCICHMPCWFDSSCCASLKSWIVIWNGTTTTLVAGNAEVMVSLIHVYESSLRALFKPNLWHQHSILRVKNLFILNKTGCQYVLLDIAEPLVEIVVRCPLNTSILHSYRCRCLKDIRKLCIRRWALLTIF